jgi:uncharacterized protein YceH (UPF0502 family)
MNLVLDPAELRVLGALIEKEITTPDYYPLSLNALQAACNQTSNRNPVVHYDEPTVARAAESLRDKKVLHVIDRGESRVTKYRHVVYEALDLGRPAVAVLCVLLLRGPQTVGEIRTRSNRLYDFSSLEEVEATLNSLASAQPPLVVSLPRQAGQKEIRYAHLLGGDVPAGETQPDKKIQKITPFLWFNNQAEEAAKFYVSIFKKSRVVSVTPMVVVFELEDLRFTALNGGPAFKFTEAVSFVVHCDTQEEIDHYWNKLAEGGDDTAQRCGWLKDKYGLSWQIVPRTLGDLLNSGDPAKSQRVMQALQQMKKLDIRALQNASAV